jgi:hypothetical protein
MRHGVVRDTAAARRISQRTVSVAPRVSIVLKHWIGTTPIRCHFLPRQRAGLSSISVIERAAGGPLVRAVMAMRREAGRGVAGG